MKDMSRRLLVLAVLAAAGACWMLMPPTEKTPDGLPEGQVPAAEPVPIVRPLEMEPQEEMVLPADSSVWDAPFYTYQDEAGNSQLELYFDPETGQGWGTRYIRREGETGLREDAPSFTVSGEYCMWNPEFLPDKTYVKSYGGTDGSETVEDYREFWEYDADGRPLRFYAQGNSDDPVLKDPVKVVDVAFSYRENGTLCRKSCWHNSYLLGTTGFSVDIVYDEWERPVFADCYITHGSLEYYYLYTGENPQPDYCLCLDFFGGGDVYAELHAY